MNILTTENIVYLALAIVWLVCELLFVRSRKKNPSTWHTDDLKKNKKYKCTHWIMVIYGIVLLLFMPRNINSIMENSGAALIQQEAQERKNHYQNLPLEILKKFDTISTYQSQAASFYDIPSRFLFQQIGESGIPSHSKLIAFSISENGLENSWIPLNEILQKNGNYSECADSINYIVCLSNSFQTDFYETHEVFNPKTSRAENVFVQIFDFNTLVIVDTMHIVKHNPESVRVKPGASYDASIKVTPEEIYSKIFRK